jgi:hypothetical protein
MLSNQETAREVEAAMRQCSAILDQSIRRVMDTCSDKEFKKYRIAVGTIMADLYLKVMQPIHQRYPDLEPPELKRDDASQR